MQRIAIKYTWSILKLKERNKTLSKDNLYLQITTVCSHTIFDEEFVFQIIFFFIIFLKIMLEKQFEDKPKLKCQSKIQFCYRVKRLIFKFYNWFYSYGKIFSSFKNDLNFQNEFFFLPF